MKNRTSDIKKEKWKIELPILKRENEKWSYYLVPLKRLRIIKHALFIEICVNDWLCLKKYRNQSYGILLNKCCIFFVFSPKFILHHLLSKLFF
jgi:hypothetical protein